MDKGAVIIVDRLCHVKLISSKIQEREKEAYRENGFVQECG